MDFWVSKNLNQPATKHVLTHWVSFSLKRALMENNITKGFSTTSIYPLDRMAVDSELGPSETYISRDVGGECGTSSTNLACGSNSERIAGAENGSNSDKTTRAENGSNSERTAGAENVPPLPNEDIDINF